MCSHLHRFANEYRIKVPQAEPWKAHIKASTRHPKQLMLFLRAKNAGVELGALRYRAVTDAIVLRDCRDLVGFLSPKAKAARH
jgi:hypothetical protein